jgi:hypothetical protein
VGHTSFEVTALNEIHDATRSNYVKGPGAKAKPSKCAPAER